jgi:hypothetical protein
MKMFACLISKTIQVFWGIQVSLHEKTLRDLLKYVSLYYILHDEVKEMTNAVCKLKWTNKSKMPNDSLWLYELRFLHKNASELIVSDSLSFVCWLVMEMMSHLKY